MQRRDSAASGPSRRRLLAAIGAGSLSGLAGCGGHGRESPTASQTTRPPTERRTPTTATGPPTATGTPTATPVATWTEGGPPDRDGWRVTFQDDFSGGTLDRQVWQHGYGDVHLQCPTHARHCAVPERSFVADDRLVLEATADDPSVPSDEQWEGRPDPAYSVGAVNTDGAFAQEFGYFEAKLCVEAAPGTNPGFWLYVDTQQFDHRELNFEFYDDTDHGDVVRFSANYEDDAGEREYVQGVHELEAPAADRFHVLGFEWGPEAVDYYVDGEHAYTIAHPAIAEHVAGQPLYLVCSWAVFEAGDWVGDPADADFPRAQEYEWIRVWQHEEYR